MLNKIILKYLSQASANNSRPKAMLSDAFEEPNTYKGWIFPIRYLLALRYQKQKQTVLTWFRTQKIYPVLNEDFNATLVSQLSGEKDFNIEAASKISPLSMLGFKASLFYPVFLAALLFGAFSVNSWYQERRIENVLANHLPFYTYLLHRKLLLTYNEGSASILEKIDTTINKEQAKILSDLPEKNGIRDIINTQLEKLKDSTASSEDIMLGFKDVNTLFDAKNLPFYLSPKSFSLPCSSLIDAPMEEMMILKKLESLMSDNKPELCRTTMMTTYKVSKRNQLYYADTSSSSNAKTGNKKEKIELPLFHVKRVDKVPAVDSALGLTFKERGIGSIILTKRIENFSRESILPALTFQGRSYVIPYWMQGYYEIEEAVTKVYKKDLNRIYPKKADRLKVKSLIKQLIKDKNRMQNSKLQQTLGRTNTNNDSSLFGNGLDAISVLLGKQSKDDKKKSIKKFEPTQEDLALLDKLDDVMLPSIEYHEAYHQIVKTDWVTPAWTKTTFKDANLSDDGLEHTMEELGAYLSQIANTEEGHNIWLSKLLIFSISPFTKGQAEHYASSIILTAMESVYLGKKITPNYKASVDEKTKIYSILVSLNNNEKRHLAKKVYEILFERNVPILSR